MGLSSQAAPVLQEAISLGRELSLPPREMVRCLYRLGRVDLHQSERITRLGEEGLALLTDDTECLEYLMAGFLVNYAAWEQGEPERFYRFLRQNEQFVMGLPYSGEKMELLTYASLFQVYYGAIEKARKLIDYVEGQAREHNDLRETAVNLTNKARSLHKKIGNLRDAILQYEEALVLWRKTGDTFMESRCLFFMGWAFLHLGDLEKAEDYIDASFEPGEAGKSKESTAGIHYYRGEIALARRQWEKAIKAFHKVLEINPDPTIWVETHLYHALGRAYLALGKREDAVGQFQLGVTESPKQWGVSYTREIKDRFFRVLGGIEEAYDDPDAFRSFCAGIRREQPKAAEPSLIQWYLEPAERHGFTELQVEDQFADSLSPHWKWKDPFGDCTYAIQQGIQIHAANGRDLFFVNESAPRILRPVSGDFAVETVCVPAGSDRPSIGGLLIWKDRYNYVHITGGIYGRHDICFNRYFERKDAVIGRGRLASERTFLRLERTGSRVNALCSADGESWFTAGHVDFPVEDPVQVGLFAMSYIDRTIHHGAFPEGTAIRFESFRLWGS
jgi:tetratricopeptide (TPR) repeat protein/regulation of enolase protein 1 (concanavalin A-like superfamily)